MTRIGAILQWRTLLPLLAFLAWGCGGGSDQPTSKVQKGDFRVSLVESGELRAVKSVSVTAPRSAGELKVVSLVGEGSLVEEGDVLVKFDPSGPEKIVLDARTLLKESVANLQKLRADRAMAGRNLELQLMQADIDVQKAHMEVSKGDLIPRVELQKARLELTRAKAALAAKKAERGDTGISWQSQIDVQVAKQDKAQGDLDSALEDLENLTVKAPLAGLVVLAESWRGGERRKVQEGDTIWPGGEILNLPDLTAMEIQVKVNEAEAGSLEEGHLCEMRLDAYPNLSYNGVVKQVGRLATKANWRSKVKTVDIIIGLDKTDQKTMKPGLSSQVEIFQKTIPDSLFIPIEAVFNKKGKDVVFVDGSFGGLKEVEVTLGDRNLTHVVVLSGLEEGDQVSLVEPHGESGSGGRNGDFGS